MKAVILAAGIGNRLKPLTDKTPKSLIKINGRTILEMMLDKLVRAGIGDITLVVGYKKEMISGLIGNGYKAAHCGYITNPDYRLGSILSVWAAREEFGRDDVLLMDADVIFEQEVLDRLVLSKNRDCFLVDKSCNDTALGEEMKVALSGGKVVQIARKITRAHDSVGEGVGFCRISAGHGAGMLKALENKIREDRSCDYEAALDDLITDINAGAEDVTGLKWTEMDFIEDIEKAGSLGIA